MKKITILRGLLVLVLLCSTSLIIAQNKITSFPYTESFESGIGDWVQSTSDDFNWTINSGETGSFGTGPIGAHDGTFYIYTEASSNFNNNTYLDASFDFSGLTEPIFSFYYHMYGSAMGSLHVDVWDGTWNLDEFVLTGQQQTANSSPWENTIIDLTSYAGIDSIVVRLRGITGPDWESDICIDKIDILEGTDMTYISSTVNQPITTNVLQNSTNNIIAVIEVTTEGLLNSLEVNTFDLNSTGTDDFTQDVDNVNIYYTGTTNTFNTSTLFGSSTDLSSAVSGTADLSNGTNYFWVTYDIAADATPENIVDVECTTISFTGTTGDQTPTTTAPVGSRTIDPAMSYLSSTVVQAVTSNVHQNTTDNILAQIEVVIDNSTSNPLEINAFDLNSTGTDDFAQDVDNVNIYFTGTNNTFNTSTLFGSSTDLSSAVSGTAGLSNGTNYFWVTYDIAADATPENIVDVECTTISFKGTTGDQTPTTTAPVGSRTIDPAMSYLSSTVVQAVTSNVHQNTTDNILAQIEVVIDNSTSNPLEINAFDLNSTGTDDFAQDVDNVNIYFTGTSNTFNTSTLFGSSTDLSSAVSGTAGLSNGTNYFWVTYDIAADATPENIVDVECTTISFTGTTGDQTPTTTAPVGSRTIDPAMSYLSSTVVQAVTSNVHQNTTDNILAQIEVVIDNSTSNPLEINAFDLNSTGTDDFTQDVDNVNIYFTGTNNTFNTSTLFGSSTDLSSAVSGTAGLSNGTNYFWVTYDIAADATPENIVDVECTTISFTGTTGDQTPTTTAPVGSRTIDPAMSYLSSTVVQAVTSNVHQNTTDNILAQIEVVIDNSTSNPLEINAFDLNSTGTDDFTQDVDNVNIYFTGTNNTFNTSTLFGSSTDLSSAVSGTAGLSNGTNYFWVTYDIAADATPENIVDVECTTISFTGTTGDQTPTTTAPVGSRTIDPAMIIDSMYCFSITDDLVPGDMNEDILGINIQTENSSNILNIESINIDSTGTDNFTQDVSKARIYATGTDNSFNTGNLIWEGDVFNSPILIPYTLDLGDNFFWVTYDIKENATIHDVVDAQCNSIIISGTEYIPTNGAPIGSRQINSKGLYSNFMPASIVVGQPDFYTQNTILDEFTGYGSNNSAVSSKGVLAVGAQSDGMGTSIGRILIWNEIPDTNGTPANVEVGNPDFYTLNSGPTASYTRNVEGVCFSPDGEKLIASDGNNNRVLIWNSIPTTNGQAADVVIGQTDFTSLSSGVSPSKLFYPTGVIVTTEGKLIITDYRNNRVLIFNQIPTMNGASADVVIGQDDFNSNTSGVAQNKLNGPWYSDVSPDGKLLISDVNNNRVLVFNEIPTSNGASANVVIGQTDFYSSSGGTSVNKFSTPVGVTVSPKGELAIGEFGNSRVLIFNKIPTSNGASADIVLGQPDFNSNTPFNGGISEKSMQRPYGINFDLNGRLYVNGRDMHRVMIFGDVPNNTADVEIGIVPDKYAVNVNDDITYTYTFTNNGPNQTSNVVVKCALPALFELNAYTAEKGDFLPFGGTWTIPQMSSGESVTLELTGTVLEGGENIRTYASIIASDAYDTDMSNNAASVDVLIVNATPTISGFTPDTIDEFNPSGFPFPNLVPFTIGDIDTDISELTLNVISSDISLVDPSSIMFDGEGESRQMMYLPVPGASGTVYLTVQVSDGYTTAESTLMLVIQSTNTDLSDILIDDVSLLGFNPATHSYSLELADGVTEIPVVTATVDHPNAVLEIFETDTLAGITTITVTAENGSKANYYVNFFNTLVALSDATLSDISIDSETIEGFAPFVYEYDIVLPFGTTIAPTPSYTTTNPSATDNFVNAISLPGSDTITVTAEDGVTTQKYIINYEVDPGSDNANLLLMAYTTETGFVLVPNFNKDILSYSIEFPYGTTFLPEIDGLPEDMDAFAINYTQITSFPGTAEAEVVAQDGVTTQTYTVNFTLAPASDDATLSELLLSGPTFLGFNPNITNYDVLLENGVAVPTLTAEANHDSATLVITDATTIPGTGTVVVTAQDGSTLTYNVNFDYEPLSNNADLTSLNVNGNLVNGFNTDIYTYDVELPAGTVEMPEVTISTYDENTKYSIVDVTSLPGTATVTVTSEDNSVTHVYTVNFTVALNDDASLSDLQVDASTLVGFDPATFVYNVELAEGTTVVPTVTYTLSDNNASDVLTNASSLPGTTKVSVTAEDGVTNHEYVINFSVAVAAGTDASLSDLQVDGETIPDFVSFVYNYTYELPYGTVTVPTVTYTPNDVLASPVLTDATSVPGTSSVEVTSEDLSTVLTYNIEFTLAPASNNADLSDIIIDGESIVNFDADVIAYTVELPYGTTVVPTVTAFTDHSEASESITDATEIPGTTSIEVTAEDLTIKTYTVEFTWAAPNNDAYLKSLSIDGTPLSTFNKNILTYNIQLAEGTVIVPTVTATSNDDSASVVVNDATSLPGKSSVIVTAQDGSTELTYNVNFTVKQPVGKDATLKDIIVNSISIDDFISTTLEYTVNLPGCTNFTEVIGIANDASASVDVNYPGNYPGQVEIVVTSLDGTEEITYLVNILAGTDATLSDLKVDGITISGFNSGTLSYDIELPAETTVVPTVTATTNDEYANASITDAASLPGKTTVKVTAEDGTTEETYEINFTVAPNTDATLSDLLVDGTTVSGFVPTILTYDVELAYGTIDVPIVTATKNDVNADVNITDATSLPGATTILVTAEDGSTEKTYVVNFTTAPNDDATLSDLKIDGSMISDFNSATLEYNVELDYGTTTVPTVTATANDVNAEVIITNAASLPGTTTVKVTAEDGVTKETYNVNFTITPNTDATLSDLKVDGTTVPGFSSTTLSYNVELAAGTTTVPTVTATTNDVNAEAVVTDAASVPGTTSVRVTAEDETTAKIYEINFTLATGINKIGLNDNIIIYPNPTSGEITISFDNTNKSLWKVEVYNSLGSILYTEELINLYKSEHYFDLSNFAKGVYFMKISNKDDAVIKQLIIK